MKMNLPFALMGAAALVAAPVWAEDSVLLGRENAENTKAPAADTTGAAPAVRMTSREEPIVVAESRETAPAPRRAAPRSPAPPSSREASGSISRSIVSGVNPETSHIVVTVDTAPAYYRYTRATQFIDEHGQMLSADAVKSGVNATLHYTRSDGDLVLTKVIINSAFRPLATRQTGAFAEVQFDR